MAKLRINGDSSGYVDLEAPNAASSSTLDLDQVPQKNAANTFSAVNNFTGNIGINRSTPQSKFEAWTGNGELSHFGSNNANATNNYTGISLGYAEAGANSNYRKVGIVAVGRADGAARQDLAFLVDSNADGNSVDLNDTKMRISHEGYVTTPNQPAFISYNVSTSTLANGSTPIFNSTIINRGNIYNTTNGRFTAPIAGLYSISGHIRVHTTTNSIAYHRLTFKKNNSYVNYSRGRLEGRTSGDYSYIENYVIIELAANDYITIEIETGAGTTLQLSAVEESAFYGYLIG